MARKKVKSANIYVLEGNVKSSGKYYHGYKIGELTNATRDDTLIAKYTKQTYKIKSTIDERLCSELPHFKNKRLNDKAVHRWIKNHPDCGLKHTVKHLIKGYFEETDGYDEWFETTTLSTDDVIQLINNIIKELSNDYNNFTAQFDPDDFSISQDIKHQVVGNNIDLILDALKDSPVGDAIPLFVGQFDPILVTCVATQSQTYIWNDDESIPHIETGIKNIDNNFVYYNEHPEDIYNMNKYFKPIANPPYSETGKFITSMLRSVNFEELILLAPISDIAPFYEYVKSIKAADPKAFNDAKIVDNLSIVVITKHPCNVFKSKETLQFMTYDQKYKEFYELNAKIEPKVKRTGSFNGDDLPDLINSNYTIYCGPYKSQYGYSDGNNIDADFNLRHIKDAVWAQYEKNKKLDNPSNGSAIKFIKFFEESPAATKHLVDYLFYNPNSNLLLKGLNKGNGSIVPAIPNIDWTKERDYRNLSIRDLINILKEENPNVA